MPITFKVTNIKIPQIARWRIAGIGDKRIAELMKMTPAGLAQLLATPEYRDYESALMEGHLSEMDKALAGKVKEIHDSVRQAVPAALRCLVDTVTQRRDLRAAMAAAKEILDRDPDRTLVPASDAPNQAAALPDTVMDSVITEANKTAQSYNVDPSKKVN